MAKKTAKKMAKKTNKKFWQEGQNYFIRTVTNYFTGALVLIADDELVFVDAAWIADTGRFTAAMLDGALNEVEPYPDGQLVLVGRGAIVDATEWTHSLPRDRK